MAQNQPPSPHRQRRPDRNQPGPWNNDVLVYRADTSGKLQKLATFPRAGVPTLASMRDGRLIAAHQHFPEDNDADFDKVAVRFSNDEGRTWTDPQVIRLTGLPSGMRFPFDPTLVPLPDQRIRLYFTSRKETRNGGSLSSNGRPDLASEHLPAIYSAISSNGIDFAFEPGVRFAVDRRWVIDCAVALHQGVFHLFAPDNGAGNPAEQHSREPLHEGIAYHATSSDGLSFTRQTDVTIEGDRRWLGNAQSDEAVLRFFGTGGPNGVWTATSSDGRKWKLEPAFPRVMGADPGAVRLKDGSWLLAVTGPPRQGAPGPFTHTPAQPRLMSTLDANGDGTIDKWELENATSLLRKLDANHDGQLTAQELGRLNNGEPNEPRQKRAP